MAWPVLNKGISLIEVLISLLIFSVAMLGSGLMVLKSFKLASDGLYQNKAAALLQMQHESIILQGVTDTTVWQQRVAQALPQGEGSVVQNHENIKIQIVWRSHFFQKQESINIEFSSLYV